MVDRRCSRMLIIVLFVISIVAAFVAYNELLGATVVFNRFIANSTDRRKHLHTPRRLPSLLCLVIASPNDIAKTVAVNKTWARRCDKTLFVYGSNKQTHLQGDKLFVNAPEHLHKLTAKVKAAFQFAFKTMKTTYDWYLKADTDTYVIVENLKLLLSYRDSAQSSYLGCHMRNLKHGYMSGGAGYVLSSGALRDMIVHGFESGKCNQITKDEDVDIGRCLEILNVTIWSSLDKHKKGTFHAEPLVNLLTGRDAEWLNEWLWTRPRFGTDCCGKFAITFHHLTPDSIYLYDHLLYKTEVYNNQSLQEDEFQNTTEMTLERS